jgi:hypothetical protein
MRGKMSRLPFPKVAEKKFDRLECIVSDICGPFQTESIGKSRYLAVFIDMYSGYTEVEFLRTRDELPDKAIEYIERMKTQLGKTIKIFRSDRAKEYLCDKLQSYLKSNGIVTQCTVARSSPQNGKAERKHRTLTEAARTLLISSGMSKRLWAEAMHHANDVFNHIPTNNKNATPYELMFQRTSKIDFHEFGSDVYVMNTNRLRKLEEKSELMQFLGNDKMSKGFRVISRSGQIQIARDVKFVPTQPKFQVNVDFGETDSEVEGIASSEPENSKSIDGPMDVNIENASNPPSPSNDSDDGIIFKTPEAQNEVIEIVDSPEIPSTPLHSRPKRQVKKPDRYGNFGLLSVETEQEPRPKRQVKKPDCYGNLELLSVETEQEPKSFQDAMSSKQKDKWMEAMKEELKSINENDTWESADLPINRKSIGSKWVYKIKRDENGNIVQYKARLVAKGFTQKFGSDYDEVFAPVARAATLRTLLSYAGKNNYIVKQFDVKTAFLNGNLQEEIYLRPPPGFETGNKVMRLKKSLYGLKQAAKVWNDTLNSELNKIGFRQCETDKCLFVLSEQNNLCYLLVHVDDFLLASASEALISKCSHRIGKSFQIKELGEIKHYLGIDVLRDGKGNFLISQTPYIEKIIQSAGLCDAHTSKYPIDPGYFKTVDEKYLSNNHEYRKLIGMLLYLTVHSRPDISASVAILSQKIEKPSVTDLNEVKRIVRYLSGTKHYVLALSRSANHNGLIAYSDANWAEDRVTRKSNSGYFCSFNGGAISWFCRRQELVSLSSTEAEFIALAESCKETVWLQRLLKFFPTHSEQITCVNVDNQSCLKMVENDKFSNRTKHIDTRFYFTKDLVNTKQLKLKYVATEHNLSDLFTKPLGPTRIKYLRELVGLTEVSTTLRDGVENQQ